jgi:2-oxoglutarate dehydrogenase E2 component (dihydrolipoamide succinyltransferase)
MPTPVNLPALGESVTEGTVVRWLKEVGEEVTADEPLLEVSTDKVDTEIPAPASGVLLEIKVGEDETVEVGAELGVIGEPGSAAPAGQEPAGEPEPAEPAPAEPEPQAPAAKEQPAPQAQTPAPAAQAPSEPAQPSTPPSGGGDVTQYVTPLVRKLASQHDVDLSTITGTGVGGRIRKQDVLEAAERAKSAASQPGAAAAAPAAPAAPAAAAPAASSAPAKPTTVEASPLRGTTQKMSRLRTVIAQRMVESLQVSAQLTTVVEVDISAVAALRSRVKNDFEAREGVKLSFLPFFAKAAIEALKVYPTVNASVDMEKKEITYHGQEHLGIAVDTERGLLVPVIKDAGDLNIGGIARRIADLAERTRTNKISPDELSGGTFTLTNTGSRGALFDTPIINQPQVAILGTGIGVKRPAVVKDSLGNEVIGVRTMMYLALSYDHRIVDGADAARFLTHVKQRLEAGQFEGDLGL